MRIYLLVILFINQASFLSAQELKYSFFVAGHASGSVNDVPDPGMHPPFVNYFDEINTYPKMSLGILTGDVVNYSTPKFWDAFDQQIQELNFPIHIAAGNHDVGDEFEGRYGSYYRDFKIDSQLFIFLTPSLNWMNIVGDQYDFLDSTLNNHQNDVDRVFIFMHELLYWSSTNEYSNVEVNYPPYYPAQPANWETILKPRFIDFGKPITIYSGDIGCRPDASPFMYHSFDNITLIASGLGTYDRDNIIVTEVYEDSVYYNLVAINSNDPGALGSLYDYSLESGMQFPDSFHAYPNPTDDFLILSHNESFPVIFTLIDAYGKTVQEFEVLSEVRSRIDISGIEKGVYFLKANLSSGIIIEQVVIK